jgi:hypothetical protein
LAQREIFIGEATHKPNTTPTENSDRFDEIEYLDDSIGIRCP